MQRLILLFIWANLIIGCSSKNRVENEGFSDKGKGIVYAKGFSLESNDSCKVLNVFNPWQGAKGIDYTYYLIDSAKQDRKFDYNNEMVFRVPLKRIVCLSTTHIAYIDQFNKANNIVGVSGSAFVNSPNLLPRIQDFSVKDVGYDQNLNYELIVSLRPDAVLCYGVGAESIGYLLKLKELGIKLIFIGDYLEDNPLGKAEWIKAFGALMNLNEKADSVFYRIEVEYLKAVELVKGNKSKPKVFLNMPYKDSWFFPGGDNYFVKLIEDAGGDYVFKEFQGSKSYSVSFEKAIETGMGSDIWLNTGSATNLSDIKSTDERLLLIKPCSTGQVFNNNLRSTPSGGNDFWESGVVHPDLVLKDLIFIFHPELLPNHKFVYYQKIK